MSAVSASGVVFVAFNHSSLTDFSNYISDLKKINIDTYLYMLVNNEKEAAIQKVAQEILKNSKNHKKFTFITDLDHPAFRKDGLNPLVYQTDKERINSFQIYYPKETKKIADLFFK